MNSCSDADFSVNDLKLDSNLKLDESVRSDRTQFTETNNLIKESLCENGNQISDSTETINNDIADSAITPDESIENYKSNSCEDKEVVSNVEMLESNVEMLADFSVNDLKLDSNLKLDENVRSDRTQFTETNNLIKEPLCENGNQISDSTETINNDIADSVITPDESIENYKSNSCEDKVVVSNVEMLESKSLEQVAGSSACLQINGSESNKSEAKAINISTNHICRDVDSSGSEDEDDDSSSTTSSSSSSSSDVDSFFATLRHRPAQVPKIRPVKTCGELDLDDLPPVEEVNITVSPNELVRLGVITSIVGKLVVIQSDETSKPLNSESVIFLSPDEPLGRVFEVLSSIYKPMYTVRFNSKEDIDKKEIKINQEVFYAPNQPDITIYVFLAELQSQKGSDASWDDNNEPPEDFIDYSDDEQERAAKKNRFLQKGKRKMDDIAADTNNEIVVVPTLRQIETVAVQSTGTKQKLKRKQPTSRGGETFHRSRHNSHPFPSTSHNNAKAMPFESVGMKQKIKPKETTARAKAMPVESVGMKQKIKAKETTARAEAMAVQSIGMKQKVKPKQPTARGGKTFHYSRHNCYCFPSTSHDYSINNNFQCNQTNFHPQQPIIHPAHFSVQRPLRFPMPPPSYPSTPLPVNSRPSFPSTQYQFHQPSAFQRSLQTPILLSAYRTPSVFVQTRAIVPVLYPVAVHPPLLNNVPARIPAQRLPPIPEHFPRRISQSPSQALQNHFPPNTLQQSSPPLYISRNLPPSPPLSVQIPPSSSPPNPINPFEHPPVPQSPFSLPSFSQPLIPQLGFSQQPQTDFSQSPFQQPGFSQPPQPDFSQPSFPQPRFSQQP